MLHLDYGIEPVGCEGGDCDGEDRPRARKGGRAASAKSILTLIPAERSLGRAEMSSLTAGLPGLGSYGQALETGLLKAMFRLELPDRGRSQVEREVPG